jgi:hypothetical protein
MYEADASCKDIARAPVTNWEPRGIRFAGYYAMRYRMNVQLVTLYCVTHLQRYQVTLRSNVTSVSSARNPYRVNHSQRYKVTLHSNVTSVYPPLIVLLH